MPHNVKLLIAYDGTHYSGWKNSIEAALREILEKIYQHPIQLQAASRTDAGVHAYGQVANFSSSKALNLEKLQCSLSKLLPKDIVIRHLEYAPEAFHPTLDARGKEYRYYVCLGKIQLPHLRLHSWHVPNFLDLDSMRKGAQGICGKRDFASFCNLRSNNCYTHFIREITSIDIQTIDNNRLCFVIRGNSFLYRMVRNIVGTLINIGRGKIALQDLSAILDGCNRTLAGVSAPAHGLFLHEVYY